MVLLRSNLPSAIGALTMVLVLAQHCGESSNPQTSADASIDLGNGGGTTSASSGASSGSSSGAPKVGSSGGSGAPSSAGSGSSTGSSGTTSASSGSSTGSSGSSSTGDSGSSTSSSGSSSSSSSGSSGSSGSSAGSSSGDAGSGGQACNPSCAGTGLSCCNGQCVYLPNDRRNCGACGVTCGGATPFCEGSCTTIPCYMDAAACSGGSCCGTLCCNSGDICCLETTGTVNIPRCYTPPTEQSACPTGCLTCVSDRNLKRDVERVDERAVLEALARMPVSTWSYNTDRAGVRHMGPMAQDFKAAFGLGESDKAYSPIDAHGVAFAAIRALYDRMQEQSARIERLEQENERLRNR